MQTDWSVDPITQVTSTSTTTHNSWSSTTQVRCTSWTVGDDHWHRNRPIDCVL